MTQTHNRLQAHQKNLLMFIRRYYSAEPWVLAAYLNIDESLVRQRSRRLVKRKMLRQMETVYGTVYRLAPRAAPVVGLKQNSRLVDKIDPHAPAISRDCAVLRYCFLGDDRRMRLTRQEFEDRPVFKGYTLPDEIKDHPYCWDAGAGALTCLRVPEASDKEAREGIENDVFVFEHTAPFGRLAANDLFRVVVLTFDETRAGAIRAQLSPSKMISVEFQTVPYQPEAVKL